MLEKITIHYAVLFWIRTDIKSAQLNETIYLQDPKAVGVSACQDLPIYDYTAI